jgi:GGDEF domain-containing protein
MLGQLDIDEAESIAQAEIIAEKLRASLSEPYILSIAHIGAVDTSVEYRCAASIGVALFNHDEAHQSGILRRADMAMYKAKHSGGNQVRFCAQG